MKIFGKIIKYSTFALVLSFFLIPQPTTQNKEQRKEQSKELVILWNQDVSADEKQAILSLYETNICIENEYDNFMLLSVIDSITAQKVHHDLSKREEISAIDFNTSIELSYTDDSYSEAQWALHNPGYYGQLIEKNLVNVYSTNDMDMNIPEAWSIYNKETVDTREVVVAIIDTGVDNNHEDLVDAMWVNSGEIPNDGIDNDKNGYIDDIFGWDFYNKDNTICHYEMDADTEEIKAAIEDSDDHGTHIAGIIAATANNKVGIAGVASNVDTKIMALKIHGGSKGKGTIADAILAIKYASTMGADIVNMSWGSTTYNKALEQVISESSMLFVTAAGNTGNNNDTTPVYPANYNLPNVISVTFINQYGSLTTKSNYGKKTVDIAAPGMDILSTTVGSSYTTMSGSSMATPHITGLAAILYSCTDNISPESVKKTILLNTKTIPSLNGMVSVPGIPNAFTLVQSLSTLVIDTKAPTLDINTYYEKDKIMLGIYAKDLGGSGIRTIRYLSGAKGASSFKNGTLGTSITSNTLELNKGGTYTFYVSDYSGNESTLIYDVLDDTQAPLVSSSYHYALDNSSITLNIKVIDELSGIKTVKYAKGVRTVKDFASGYLGTTLTIKNDSNTLRLYQSGDYTIYVTDFRGNKAVHVVSIAQHPITSISLPSNEITLSPGELHKIDITYTPSATTDKIFYVSSNPSVVSVSQWGALHAKATGRSIISIKTTSGLVKKFLVVVK